VKLIDRDERGRLRLSMKALLPKPEGGAEAPAGGESVEGGEGGEARAERPRGDRPRGGRGGRGGRDKE